ncbi:MAG: isopentenyl-diphosphate Delta-isomerase, partial [Patescibacteria group bacterium]|nr:isopentenyl-diphosphate Delta-isomerase [Patescibacteria group bacterium]
MFKNKTIKVVIITKNDQVIGTKPLLKAHQNPPQLHRAVSVLLFNSKKELLIQQRSTQKPLWPLYWSNTICTHPLLKETYQQAAERRLKEEFGIKTKLYFKYKFKYKARYTKDLSEHELDHVFLGKSDTKPKPDKNEIADFKYI